MTRQENDRLRDIKDAIVTIHEHLARAEQDSSEQDTALLHDAILYEFVVIGEAVKYLSPQTRDSTPEIPLGERSRAA